MMDSSSALLSPAVLIGAYLLHQLVTAPRVAAESSPRQAQTAAAAAPDGTGEEEQNGVEKPPARVRGISQASSSTAPIAPEERTLVKRCTSLLIWALGAAPCVVCTLCLQQGWSPSSWSSLLAPAGIVLLIAYEVGATRSNRRDSNRVASPEETAEGTAGVFASNQQTDCAQQQTLLWLARKSPKSWKISMPPFNRPVAGLLLDPICQQYNPPVFGLRIPKALMALFEVDGVKELARELNVTLPAYTISRAIQDKMHKVRRLVAEARKRTDCQAGQNAEAVRRLERFIDGFVALRASDIASPEAWDRWVCGHTGPGWMDKLEFSALLSNFGFDEPAAKALQTTEIDDPQDDGTVKMVSLEQYSLRWLSKAMAGYNVSGCLTDVASLVFAMNGAPPAEKPSERDVVNVIENVTSKIRAGDWLDLWVPSAMVHDAERDDILAWLLLRHIHQCRGTELAVLVQLPTPKPEFPELEKLDELFKRHGCETFRDPSSRNASAIKHTYHGT